MSETKIVHLFGVEGGKLLLVFYTSRHSYQFRLVTDLGEVIGDEKIYYTAEAALTEGQKGLEGRDLPVAFAAVTFVLVTQ